MYANRNVPDSSTRACTQMDLKNTHILGETKLLLIVHVSVSKTKDKRDNIRLSPFYYSGISTILRSIFFSKRTCK